MKRLIPLVAVVALAAASCGETVIDTTKIEEQAKSDLEKKLSSRGDLQKELGIGPHEKITAVECPSGQEVETGNTFACEIVFANGNKGTETFEIVDKEADVHQVGKLEPGSSPSK
jgi:hypothetical protein